MLLKMPPRVRSVWLGKRAGTIGHVGAFKCQQGKVPTAGESGIAVTVDEGVYIKLQQLRADTRVFTNAGISYGDMELVTSGRFQGSNHCISEFQAAILFD
ncbi:DegT/DnrJ/EryC1/StrS family aminotransferase [Paenibacillus sp. MZ03-122A]|uniref:DegT/DnrJ/EryC1/StrS family aminotransferase n=1 Tax=Paenibacillus sp. MZ03-122A TaxID=2962033 RepID=UPI0020B6768B|nr:DegT/DnrJ/EryC1/StrS family aminotransferase [Paenibacillus sp. MZ03-122A]MCP3781452.1 DegT/DnrJ/EryC1/StrS family aminotransferase [Paenibacillus sp. MZ03-122A]